MESTESASCSWPRPWAEYHEDALIRRLCKRKAGANRAVDAIPKTLRAYTTWAYPILWERFDFWYRDGSTDTDTIGNTFTYSRTHITPANRVMNFLLQPLYEQEPNEDGTSCMIYPRLSTKTRGDHEDRTMQAEIHSWVAANQTDRNEQVVTLRKLAESELGVAETSRILDLGADSVVFTTIRSYIRQHAGRFRSDSRVVFESRERRPDLTISVKYYTTRDDNRAYVRDSNKLRHLVASCYNRLISPKSMQTRCHLESAIFLRPMDKDNLNLSFDYPVPTGDCLDVTLVIGDVSNFTGSLANAWLMTSVMGLELLLNEKLEDKTNLYGVAPSLAVQAKWSEIVMLYLYTTVGIEAFNPEMERYEHLPGGFLGVAGNMSNALLFYSLFFKHLAAQLLIEYTIIPQVQVGGDDFAFLFTSPRSLTSYIQRRLRYEIELYVGKLKEFESYTLTGRGPGTLDDARFCKKGIVLHRDGDRAHLTSITSFPLPECLMSDYPPMRQDERAKKWYSYDASLSLFESRTEGTGVLCDTARFLYVTRHPVDMVRRVSKYKLKATARLITCGWIRITDTAHEIVRNTKVFDCGLVSCLTDYEACVRHNLIFGLIRVLEVGSENNDSEKLQIHYAPGELSEIARREVTRISVGGRMNTELLARLLKSSSTR